MLSTPVTPVRSPRPSQPAIRLQDFKLPPQLEATEPPEARGLKRDQVRLLVSDLGSGRLSHSRFDRLPEFLRSGDVLVINTSGTLNAALPTHQPDGAPLKLHLSTHLPDGLWVLELRQPDDKGRTKTNQAARAGDQFDLPAGGRARLLRAYRHDRVGSSRLAAPRLWLAVLELPRPLNVYLERYGEPIRYDYVRQAWPLSYYQTVYATQPGSAEMPSAGRAFTPELITRLVAQGVQIVPLLLHTGVASLEEGEAPYPEYYHLPAVTARAVNTARATRQRVIAVGTTSVRALETAADKRGLVQPGEGWSDLVITPARGLVVVDGLLTGFHEPKASHLDMLAALAGIENLQAAYREAIRAGYLWHEFGDLHLILPDV